MAVAAIVFCWYAPGQEVQAQNVSGKTDYLVACAACHGRSGKGDGPVASELRIAPPDLTLLEKKNGVFPTRIVEEVIDGRKSLRAHGNYEMPVWGNVLSQLQPDRTQGRIRDIVEYVRSIQAH